LEPRRIRTKALKGPSSPLIREQRLDGRFSLGEPLQDVLQCGLFAGLNYSPMTGDWVRVTDVASRPSPSDLSGGSMPQPTHPGFMVISGGRITPVFASDEYLRIAGHLLQWLVKRDASFYQTDQLSH